MVGGTQKSVTIRLELWDQIKADYEADTEGWINQGITSVTALLVHYLVKGREVIQSGDQKEIEQLRHDLDELKRIVLEKLASE